MSTNKTGAYIKQKRTELGMTQSELAEKINCTDKAVSRWETGRGFPDYSMLEPLSKALGISVNELVLGEDIPNEEYQNKSDEIIVDTIKKKDKQKNIFITIVIVFLILVSVYTFKRIVMIDLFQNLMENSEVVNPYSYFLTPREAIDEAVSYTYDGSKYERGAYGIDGYRYGKSIFVKETETRYIEFFVSADESNVWLFMLDKVNFEGVYKYRTNYLEGPIQSTYSSERNVKDTDYYFKMVENEEDLTQYEALSPQITEYQMNTVAFGEITQYLVFWEQEPSLD